ncbi:MAG: acylneuraminate cytidylyltransferase, partial [Pseudomonadota bacterium]
LPIIDLARELGLRCVVGHPTDLIDRHLQAAHENDADVIVKIPSDCPLVDPRVVDQVVGTFRRLAPAIDYVSNLHPPTWPDGNDVEVFSRAALEKAHREADRAYEREHTTPFLWDQPARFRLASVTWVGGRDLSRTHRLTVDYPEDLEVVDAVYQALSGGAREAFTVEEIVSFLDRHAEIRELNAHHRNTGWPSSYAGALRTGGASLGHALASAPEGRP